MGELEGPYQKDQTIIIHNVSQFYIVGFNFSAFCGRGLSAVVCRSFGNSMGVFLRHVLPTESDGRGLGIRNGAYMHIYIYIHMI